MGIRRDEDGNALICRPCYKGQHDKCVAMMYSGEQGIYLCACWNRAHIPLDEEQWAW